MPLTPEAEFDYGRRMRASGLTTHQLGFYQEVSWLARNGVTGMAVDARTRVLVPAGKASGSDFLLQVRLYN